MQEKKSMKVDITKEDFKPINIPIIEVSKSSKTRDTKKEGQSLFSLVIPQECYITFDNLINLKLKERQINYNLTSAFLEGLFLLKIEYPFIDNSPNTVRRRYRGGKQKNKVESVSTSIWLKTEDISWINNYIYYKMLEDIYFLKADFILDLIGLLKAEYKTKNQII